MEFLVLVLSVFYFSLASAHGGGFSTKEFCSIESPKTCAHAHFLEYPNTNEASEFIVHVETSNDEIVRDIKLDLWMDMGDGHGHGSAPVEVTPDEEESHFQIKNAWFPMMGEWLIRVKFLDNNQERTVLIPVNIKE